MDKLKKFCKSFPYSLWLGLLTFLLVAIAIPAVANDTTTEARSSTVWKTEISSDLSWRPNLTEVSKDLDLDFLSQGKAAYEAGKFDEAVRFWQQARQKYRQIGDKAYEALSANYTALAYQELGKLDRAEENLQQSLKLLESKTPRRRNTANIEGITAQVMNTQGSLQLARGKAESALRSWQQAEQYYQHQEDDLGLLGSKLNQAQALQQLGLYRRSHKILTRLQKELRQQPNLELRALGLRSLGNALQVTGDLDESRTILQESLELTKSLNAPEATSAVLFSLGNVARAANDPQSAIAFYQQAATKTNNPLTAVESKLNQINLLANQEQWQTIRGLIPDLKTNLADLSPSRRVIYAKVNFAKNLLDLKTKNPNLVRDRDYIPQLLKKTIKEAETLKDSRGRSYTLGTLGYWYEQQQKYQAAREVTEQALTLAVNSNAPDINYQWQWQLGRLLQAQGDISGAISAETEAVSTLQDIRGDLVATNTDLQFSFRESVEPIYRNLVSLLLRDSPDQERLVQARQTIESLQLAELENYFREACIDAKPKQIDKVDKQAAVVYPIILPDRLGVILALPDSSLTYYEHLIAEDEVEQTLDQLLQSFNPIYSNKKRLKVSKQVYDWLIKPGETVLVKGDIQTLVFVLDGSLRNLPMAALYDGEQYLIEKYRLALTPGLQLLEPKSLENNELKAVVAGLSESNQGFAALPGVETEVSEISRNIPAQTLLNQEFTNTSLREQIRSTSSPLVHLATHGQFSSNPEETFIVTWDDQIKVKEFEDLLRVREETIDAQPIELLVMSACQTAAGDKRAALGIAGVAVRSGARSTLATLWSVKDDSTVVLMDKFYQQLVQSDRSLTKSEALRQAQISLIRSDNFDHPFYWAPFILVGNWL